MKNENGKITAQIHGNDVSTLIARKTPFWSVKLPFGLLNSLLISLIPPALLNVLRLIAHFYACALFFYLHSSLNNCSQGIILISFILLYFVIIGE